MKIRQKVSCVMLGLVIVGLSAHARGNGPGYYFSKESSDQMIRQFESGNRVEYYTPPRVSAIVRSYWNLSNVNNPAFQKCVKFPSEKLNDAYLDLLSESKKQALKNMDDSEAVRAIEIAVQDRLNSIDLKINQIKDELLSVESLNALFDEVLQESRTKK